MKVSSNDLMHHRLQAWLRENTCEDISYIGVKKDHNGEEKHFYRIGEHEVPHDCIDSLEMEEIEEE
tara:strand:+ start:184 stop:381 length:198 start_codon:yes stop_codon:yes gene_type:complete